MSDTRPFLRKLWLGLRYTLGLIAFCTRHATRAALSAWRSPFAERARSYAVTRWRAWRSTGASFLRTGAALAALTLLTLALFHLFVQRVDPGRVGVRQVRFGVGGVVQDDFGPGLHFSLIGLHRWHHLDARLQYLGFTPLATRPGDRPALAVRTRDGNQAHVIAQVLYRIRAGEAHELVQAGLEHAYPERVRAAAERVLSEELSALDSVGLVSTDLRRAQLDAVLPRLDALLAEVHCEAVAVEVQGFYFPTEYEKKLQERQLAEQLKLRDEVQLEVERHRRQVERFEKELAEREKLEVARWDKRIEELRDAESIEVSRIRAEADAYEAERKADAELEHERLLAEARLAQARAEAERKRMRNTVLETAGGRIHLAREAASSLRFRRVTLDSNDPRLPSLIDLDGMVRLLKGEAR